MAVTNNRAKAYIARVPGEKYDRDWMTTELQLIQQAVPVTAIRTISQAVTQLPTDRLVLVDTSGGGVTYTLLAPTNAPIFPVTVKKISNDANLVTIGGTVDGTASPTFAVQYTSWTMQSDGTYWWII